MGLLLKSPMAPPGAVRFTLPSASAPRARRAARRDGLLTGGGSVQRLAAGVIPFEPDSAATFEFQGRRELRCLSRGERHSLTFKPFLARRSFPLCIARTPAQAIGLLELLLQNRPGRKNDLDLALSFEL